jgi:hypothetical protein
MPTQITISSLSGFPPFDVYTCDTGFTSCIYINTIGLGQIPYVFNLPFIMEDMGSYVVKVVDSNNCMVTQELT